MQYKFAPKGWGLRCILREWVGTFMEELMMMLQYAYRHDSSSYTDSLVSSDFSLKTLQDADNAP